MIKKLQILLIPVLLIVGCFAVGGCSLADPINHPIDENSSASSISKTIDDIKENLLDDNPAEATTTDDDINTDADAFDAEELNNIDTSQILQQATVIRVVDGDTFLADVDGKEEYIRLIGVDTPESVHPDEDRNTGAGDAASAHTKEILPVGTIVWLEKDVSNRDKYDRLLRYVWVEHPNDINNEEEVKAKMLNAQLVSDGWAEAKSYPPDTKWNNYFETLTTN